MLQSARQAGAEIPRDILGVGVHDVSHADALEFVHGRIAARAYTPITFLNAHNANVAAGNAEFRRKLRDFAVFSDGIGVDLAARILYGRPFRANLNGTDFVPAMLKTAPRPLKIGLYGARPGIAGKAAERFRSLDARHEYRVFGHGYLGAERQERALDQLERWQADILLVALGVPQQEQWIAETLTYRHCTVSMGVGALFDIITDTVPRAPRWVRAMRCEWLYRLWREPRRMWRRYLFGNPAFLFRIALQKLTARERSAHA